MIMSPTGGGLENSLIEGNAAGTMGGGAFASTTAPFPVRNNIVTDNANGGLVCPGAGIQADHNNVWNNSGGDYGSGTPGANDIAADPLFVDPGSGNYGLGLHSPCLDRGDPDPACADPDASPADIGLLGGPQARPVAPAAISGASITDNGDGSFTLSWSAGGEPDLAEYVVYRDTADFFEPGPEKVVATVPHPGTSWQDTPPHGCYYLVVPVDSEGHVGGYSPRLQTAPVTAVGQDNIPTSLAISRVAPNPFNPRTTIWLAVPRAQAVTLNVYDLRGRRVRNLIQGQLEPGHHEVTWDGADATGRVVAAGVYFVRAIMGGETVTTKVMLAK